MTRSLQSTYTDILRILQVKVERIKEKKVLPKNQSIFSEKYMRKFNAGDYVSFARLAASRAKKAEGPLDKSSRIFGLIKEIQVNSYPEESCRLWAEAVIICNDLTIEKIDLCWLRLESKNVSQ